MISSSVIKFFPILGVPPWLGGGWVDGNGSGYGCVGSVTCTHAHAHTRRHAHTHMHVKHDKHDKHGCLHVGGHLQFLYMRLRVCACMDMHMHVWSHPPTPQMPPDIPPPTCPLPRAAGSRKHQNSITLELINIFRFCLKILYLCTFLNSYRLQLITLNTPTHLPHPQS